MWHIWWWIFDVFIQSWVFLRTMSLCYVYNINAIPQPPGKLHCDITEDMPRTPLANWNIPPPGKNMDPRMMLAGINRRYEYVGDYRYKHRCRGSRVHVTSMFPRWRALSVVNQARTAPDLRCLDLCLQKKLCRLFEAQVWYASTIYLARIQTFFSVKRRSWWKRDIWVCRGREVWGNFTN